MIKQDTPHRKLLIALPPAQISSALVGWNISESGKQQYKNSGLGADIRGQALEDLFAITVVSRDSDTRM